MNNEQEKKLFKKLISPVHINYISKYILECDIFETKDIINDLVSQNILRESEYGKDYYVLNEKNKTKV